MSVVLIHAELNIGTAGQFDIGPQWQKYAALKEMSSPDLSQKTKQEDAS